MAAEIQKLNRLNDYLFKYIFGRSDNKAITISLLNAILGLDGDKAIAQLDFIDREYDPKFAGDKLSRLDILTQTGDGSRIDIEVQVLNLGNIEKRTLFYWTQIYNSLKSGQDYNELHRVVTINILAYNLLPKESVHSVYHILEDETKHLLTDDLEIHFIEMKKFRPKAISEMNRLERWLAYLSDKLTDEEREELAMSEAAISQAMSAEKVFLSDEAERWRYLDRENAIRDYRSGNNYYYRQGRLELLNQVVRNMRQQGMTEANIAAICNLSLSELKEFA